MIRLAMAAATAVLALGVAAVPGVADGHKDHWSGLLSGPAANDGYQGKVQLNYRAGRDDWLANLTVEGLAPNALYQAIIYYGNDVAAANRTFVLGCFTTDAAGDGHLKVKGLDIPHLSRATGGDTSSDNREDRVNVRPASEGCEPSDSAVLSTWTNMHPTRNWGGSGLTRNHSSRGK